MHKCSYPNGMSIRPDGVHELDPCVYEPTESYANVTIEILKCKRCGHTEITWRRQSDTIQLERE